MRYFTPQEFDCKETKENQMDPRFLKRLDRLRGKCGFAFVIVSGYRSPNHSVEIVKEKPGQHTKGLAVDIKVTGGHQRFLIVHYATEMGFSGIGVGKNFIHVDDRVDTPVVWSY